MQAKLSWRDVKVRRQFGTHPIFQSTDIPNSNSILHSQNLFKSSKTNFQKKRLVLTHKEARPQPIFEEEKMYQRRFSFDKPRFKQLYISSFFQPQNPYDKLKPFPGSCPLLILDIVNSSRKASRVSNCTCRELEI